MADYFQGYDRVLKVIGDSINSSEKRPHSLKTDYWLKINCLSSSITTRVMFSYYYFLKSRGYTYGEELGSLLDAGILQLHLCFLSADFGIVHFYVQI